jgi:hypothetical protein
MQFINILIILFSNPAILRHDMSILFNRVAIITLGSRFLGNLFSSGVIKFTHGFVFKSYNKIKV